MVAVGLFGSLARGGWGVGSDADLVVVVEASDAPFLSRALAFPADALPVPADVLVYTAAEWAGPALAAARRDVQWLSGAYRMERLGAG